ncbi:MAG TPA: RluA family pseudouridine synthase [Alphaproteobacteria bacterium]|nr:MAG: RluA family pseudouridine synthase [Rhodospirillales bacterium]HOO81800.1 RluA family pseudouridine synthase [Alphaproteobacteria bacterium]
MDECSDKEKDTLRFIISEEQVGQRLDKALAALADGFSRSRLQGIIQDGALHLNGLVCRDVSHKVSLGSVIEIEIPPVEEAAPQPEKIALNVIYEDEDVLVINKPAGLVVHPGAGNASGTLVNALLYHCGESLSGIGGVARPGIVHRLDKDTSGLMVVAKHDRAHQGLAAQLEDRSLSRIYEALALKVPVPVKGVVDMPIGRDPRNRLKMSVKGQNAKPARTHYRVLKAYGEALSLVECKLESGRTHQIRVHMQALKHPLIGDPLYRAQDTAVRGAMKKAGYEEDVIMAALNFPRQALHAKSISFVHPLSGEVHNYEVDAPDDFFNLLKKL